MQKQNLKGLSPEELEKFFLKSGEKRFRADQLFAWMYRRNVINFDDMTDISKNLKAKLSEIAFIGEISLKKIIKSQDSTTQKFLFTLSDGHQIESVLMFEDKRTTVCLSSQVGCALGCRFCATASLGFKRNLEAWEIVEQLLAIKRITGAEVTNIVLMGMGEPFLNYDNVIKACYLMNHKDGIAIGQRKIVISTSGIVPKLIQYSDESHPFKLAISLNAPTNATRNEIMPINKKYPLQDLIKAARYYSRKSRHRITFEYVLLSGFNDSPTDAENLKKLLKEFPSKINLIPLNEVSRFGKRPEAIDIQRFYEYFLNFPAVVSIRWSKGTDIQAACGQLAAAQFSFIHESQNLPD